MRDELAALRRALVGTGGVARIAEAMGLPYHAVYDEIRRENARAGKATAKRGRVCPCGAAVHNDWATDYRRCEGCRSAAGAGRFVARFSEGARP